MRDLDFEIILVFFTICAQHNNGNNKSATLKGNLLYQYLIQIVKK